ncbi:MAG: ATP-binding protein [Clostridiales bacterium]|nr:MAG: ATP-binding protein [Clostridiales bacterium]
MSENCNGNCSSCSANCESRQQESMLTPLNEYSRVGKVIGVVSGKGGVGKSAVTAMLATLMARKGYKCAVLDADLTGPSIPKVFGVHGIVTSEDGEHLLPAKTAGGIDIMSINLLLESEDAPVIWRGPVISGVIKQFWSDVIWNDIDYMFVDMPPGTGDVSLTVFQSLPLDGVVMVTTPQSLVGMIVKKSLNMARMMNIPVLGLVENMSYITCPDCGKRIDLFGKQSLESEAAELGVPVLGRLPLDPALPALADAGRMEAFQGDWLDAAAEVIEKL